MVCSVGNGRMAVMTRLLAPGTFSRATAEEVGNQKLAYEFICRELRDANEANLIDEEDMHIFGLNPMADPLNLVCCNNCKKPVKASQYITHAELCQSLNFRKGTIQDSDGGTEHRKNLRKEKKKSIPLDANISAKVREQSESINADYSAASAPQVNDQFGIVKLTKRISTCEVAPEMGGSGVCPSVVDHPACSTFPSTKRSKLITEERLLVASDLEPSSVKTKIKNVPYPLASKIYYSQRNNHLRSALGYLYWEAEASSKEVCNAVDHQMTKENTYQKQTSLEQTKDNLGKKMGLGSQSTSAWKPDQNVAQPLDILSVNSGKWLPTHTASSKMIVGNVAWPPVAPVELMQTEYLPGPRYFKGKPLGTRQQPSGSVPVV